VPSGFTLFGLWPERAGNDRPGHDLATQSAGLFPQADECGEGARSGERKTRQKVKKQGKEKEKETDGCVSQGIKADSGLRVCDSDVRIA